VTFKVVYLGKCRFAQRTDIMWLLSVWRLAR